jgi:hypothetical protein
MKLAMKGAAGLLITAAVWLAGCARVEPWDRDVLARPDMQLVADPIESADDEHIYFSKEGSTGGQDVGGGGCGCN